MTDPLDRLLAADPLAAVEELTGRRHSEWTRQDEILALFAGMSHATATYDALMAAGDTTICNDLDRYVSIVERCGFEKVLEDQVAFAGNDIHPASATQYFVFAHRDGLLLGFDTYTSGRVNSGNLYYNWRPRDAEAHVSIGIPMGGMYHPDGHYEGYHDCREAFVHRLGRLRARGTFVSPWERPHPMLRLTHWAEYKGALPSDRLSCLPDWVKEFVAL